jgi:hypothetical protein
MVNEVLFSRKRKITLFNEIMLYTISASLVLRKRKKKEWKRVWIQSFEDRKLNYLLETSQKCRFYYTRVYAA